MDLRAIFRHIVTAPASLFPHPAIETVHHKYAAKAYPSNHTFKISRKGLIPKRKLASRYKKISKLFPNPLTSLVEIGSCKGFFILSASRFPQCERALGIDIHDQDLHLSQLLKQQLDFPRAQFAKLRLDQLADNIQYYGGPFQTVLVLNIYQYLYFGSDPCPDRYLSHDTIFQHLRKICKGRIIFNNRVTIQDCQNQRQVALAGETYQKLYTPAAIKAAASTYFDITEHGKIGRYPLWTLDVKPLIVI